MGDETTLNAVELATESTIAWLANRNNRAAAEDVPAFVRTMHATVTEIATGKAPGSGEGVRGPATGGRWPVAGGRWPNNSLLR